MKTTIEIPDELLMKAKKLAAVRQKTFKSVLIEALRRVVAEADVVGQEPGWKHCFGRSRGSRAETLEIQNMIDRDFSKVRSDEWS